MVVENKQTSVLLACDSAEEETKMFRNPSLPAVLAPANQIWVAFGIRMTSFTLLCMINAYIEGAPSSGEQRLQVEIKCHSS